jgi:hypothetical protein
LTLFSTIDHINKAEEEQKKATTATVTLITVYDNYRSNPELETAGVFLAG